MQIRTAKIESLLAENNMTKADLAKKSCISRQSISTIIRRGSCEPRTVGKLAFGLGVPISDIIEEVGT